MFPGIIATFLIERLLNFSPNWNSFRFGMNAFILGVFAYIFLQGIVFLIGLFPSNFDFLTSLTGTLDVWDFAKNIRSEPELSEVFAAALLSPVMAVIVSQLANRRWWLGMKWLAGSSKYGNENLFSYFLETNENTYYVVRDTVNNVLYQGVITAFSETDDIQELLMKHVTVFVEETGDIIEELDEAYISKPIGTFLIEKPKTEEPHAEPQPEEGDTSDEQPK